MCRYLTCILFSKYVSQETKTQETRVCAYTLYISRTTYRKHKRPVCAPTQETRLCLFSRMHVSFGHKYDARDTLVCTHPSGRSLAASMPLFHRSLSTCVGLFSHTQVSFVGLILRMHVSFGLVYDARDTHVYTHVCLFLHL